MMLVLRPFGRLGQTGLTILLVLRPFWPLGQLGLAMILVLRPLDRLAKSQDHLARAAERETPVLEARPPIQPYSHMAVHQKHRFPSGILILFAPSKL